jgi:hypothetical protein
MPAPALLRTAKFSQRGELILRSDVVIALKLLKSAPILTIIATALMQ